MSACYMGFGINLFLIKAYSKITSKGIFKSCITFKALQGILYFIKYLYFIILLHSKGGSTPIKII